MEDADVIVFKIVSQVVGRNGWLRRTWCIENKNLRY